jgi:hypothetical protein
MLSVVDIKCGSSGDFARTEVLSTPHSGDLNTLSTSLGRLQPNLGSIGPLVRSVHEYQRKQTGHAPDEAKPETVVEQKGARVIIRR